MQCTGQLVGGYDGQNLSPSSSSQLISPQAPASSTNADWTVASNRRDYLDRAFGKKNWGSAGPTYAWTVAHGGRGLLSYYGNSALYMVMGEYPERVWRPWLFERVPKRWWTQTGLAYHAEDPCAVALVRQMVESVEERQGFTEPRRWLLAPRGSLGENVIRQFGDFGGLWLAVFHTHQELVPLLCDSADPAGALTDAAWESLALQLTSPHRHSANSTSGPLRSVMRLYFAQLMAKYKLTSVEAFYQFLSFDQRDQRRLRLLGPLPKVLESTYPEIEWNVAKFETNPALTEKIWAALVVRAADKDAAAVAELRAFVEHCALLLGEDPAISTWEATKTRNLPPLFRRRIAGVGGLAKLLVLAYPGQNFRALKSKKHKTQRGLHKQVDKVLAKPNPTESAFSGTPL